ncbi:hypothetical protein [Enterococcus gilvus]|nr:hypothetical protein [Enterococcus gilvus]MDN6002983.1 hypothetical protein [Enterococcus sp.]MDN6216002.1 hypothetical protein [Enterococcus sp.]MDN6519036.1 hypothetical protein [Enterococcus sp.]MDN6561824.1 hypothetical protein [Enterococcus sp.]MDN6583489.1 hypothetical protein [Enterococcus sp.]
MGLIIALVNHWLRGRDP